MPNKDALKTLQDAARQIEALTQHKAQQDHVTATMMTQLSLLQELIGKKNEEITSLKGQLQSQTDHASQLRKENEKLQEDLDDLRADLSYAEDVGTEGDDNE